jgi:hypothetical protein
MIKRKQEDEPMCRKNRNLQAAIWLIGIGILALTHHWWPGILVLVGISMVAAAFIRGEDRSLPSPPASEDPTAPPVSPAVTSSIPDAPIPPHYDLAWLPAHCPKCGGPLNVNGLQILDGSHVTCPFCGSKIQKE